MLFVPFSILFLWAFHKELFDSMENLKFGKTIWAITKIVATFSFIIEFLQLLFHLGTFQISDLCYNTLDLVPADEERRASRIVIFD